MCVSVCVTLFVCAIVCMCMCAWLEDIFVFVCVFFVFVWVLCCACTANHRGNEWGTLMDLYLFFYQFLIPSGWGILLKRLWICEESCLKCFLKLDFWLLTLSIHFVYFLLPKRSNLCSIFIWYLPICHSDVQFVMDTCHRRFRIVWMSWWNIIECIWTVLFWEKAILVFSLHLFLAI